MNSIKPIAETTLLRRLKQRRVKVKETLKLLSMAKTQSEKQEITDYLNSL
jgi:hypothetical protein